MWINVNLATSQGNRTREYADDLRRIKSELSRIRENLSYGWKADEFASINNAIDRINREIASTSLTLDSLGSDIIAVAKEIKREEEATARAEAEAKAKREAALKA